MIIDTKEILAKAFVDLSKENSIDKITIQMIVEKCNTGRQTFYNHFKDKNDLINWIYTHKLDQITYEWSDKYSYYECVRLGFAIFLEDKKYFKKTAYLIGQNTFPDRLFEVLVDFYTNHITRKFGVEALTKEVRFAIDFLCHGSCQQCFNWLKTGMHETPEYIATQIVNCCPNILRPFLEQKPEDL